MSFKNEILPLAAIWPLSWYIWTSLSLSRCEMAPLLYSLMITSRVLLILQKLSWLLDILAMSSFDKVCLAKVMI